MEKYHDDSLATGAISKLRVLSNIEPLVAQKPDRLILGIIRYNQLIQDVIEPDPGTEDEDQEDSGEFNKNIERGNREILAALKKGYSSVKKRKFNEAVNQFEKLENQGISEGKFFKGMTIMLENPSNFYYGLREMVEATLDTMNEDLLANLQKVLEAGQKAGLIRKAKELKYNVDRNQLCNFLQLFLESDQNPHDQRIAATRLLEALRQYYK